VVSYTSVHVCVVLILYKCNKVTLVSTSCLVVSYETFYILVHHLCVDRLFVSLPVPCNHVTVTLLKRTLMMWEHYRNVIL